jgi:hypothetical protein
MHLTTRIERHSLAYISAVAASAGYECVESRSDFDSVDGVLRSFKGARPRIEFQAKGTTRSLLRADHVSFPLSKKNYDELSIETLTPRLLFVVILPDEETAWLSHSEDELALRHCGYWLSLRGMPRVDNAQSITVHLPRAQQLTVAQLNELMAKAEQGPAL